jgi:NAD-dependent protein deacetylase/lipoamidase
MKAKVHQLAKKIAGGGSTVIFTGAGISTESGIPDYRSQGGIWDQFRPVYFDEFMSSRDARIEYWRQKDELYTDLLNAKPNAAHMAVADLFKAGLVQAIITQNIDGLHQESGIPDENVIELHGSNRRVRCMTCKKTSSIHDAHERIKKGDPAPECACGGYLKPDTVSFGQSMPADDLQRSIDLSNACDVFIVIGSTLLVQPAALLPDYARQGGAFLAIVNLSETPYDAVCDVLIQRKAGDILPEIVSEVSGIVD